MWKLWKKEIIGFSIGAVVVICALTILTLQMRETVELNYDYKPHVMVDGVSYWIDGSFPTSTLPEGYQEFAVIEENIDGRLAEKNGQASGGFAVGSKVYRNPAQPGWVYASLPDDRFTRLTVIELQKTFLRYQGSLYIASHSAPYDVDLPGYHAKHCHSTGEIVTYIRGDHLPTEDLTTHSERYDGCEVFRNDKEPDMLYLKQVRTLSNGRIQTEYEPFVKAESVGLDYSAYEWK